MRRCRPPALRAVLIGCGLVFAAAPAARAQDLDEPPPITPDLALLAAQQAYTTAPIAERLQIRLDGARSWITLRIAPGRTTELSDAAVALELGDLKIDIRGGVLLAANTRAPGVFYQADLDELTLEALEDVLPPIPLPQLALAAGWRDGDDLTPYTTGVHWTEAAWDDQPAAGVVRLEGTAEQGPVTLELDRESGRLVHLLADTPAGRLEIIAEPVEAQDPQSWRIDTTGRERVERLSALTERARPIQVGDMVQDLPMLDRAGAVRPLSALFSQGPPEWVNGANRRIVLILAPLGEPGDKAASADPEAFVRMLLAGVDLLVDEADAGEGDLCPFAAYLVVFIQAGGFEREAVDAAANAWDVPAERLLWSPIQMPQFAGVERGEPAAIVVDAQRRVLAIVGADGLAGDAGDAAGRLRPALACPGE